MNITVKPRLEKVRKEKGLTQIELAVLAGVPQAAISRFDKSTQCQFTNLFAIAKALGVPVEYLFEISEGGTTEV